MREPSLQNKRILVVEDNVENMKLFHTILRIEGAEVLEADNASTAIEIAKTMTPDLILMDIHMPGMDGITASRLLSDDELTRNIPIIAVTASVMDKDRKLVIDAGCIGMIPKPIEPGAFVAELNRYLSG